MKSLIPVAALACCLIAAPSAGAQGPLPAPTPTVTPTPTPTPVPATGTLRVKPVGTAHDGPRRVVVAGRSFTVAGTVTPFVDGQTVTVTVYRDGKRVRKQVERLVPSRDGRSGTFRTLVRGARLGTYRVKALHAATPQLARLRSNTVRVLAIDGAIAPGARGVAVRLLQRGLARLHYAVPRSGVLDAGTQRAILAWRKVTGRPRTFTASRDVLLGVLAGRGAWHVRHPRDGHHVEADLSLQVMALIDGSKVRRIYHISSGAPATPTVLGRFRVYRKDPGTNAKGMVHSSYFTGGYAIHGYVSVPPFNASHGCLRVPIPDSWSIYRWARMGTVVWVEP